MTEQIIWVIKTRSLLAFCRDSFQYNLMLSDEGNDMNESSIVFITSSAINIPVSVERKDISKLTRVIFIMFLICQAMEWKLTVSMHPRFQEKTVDHITIVRFTEMCLPQTHKINTVINDIPVYERRVTQVRSLFEHCCHSLLAPSVVSVNVWMSMLWILLSSVCMCAHVSTSESLFLFFNYKRWWFILGCIVHLYSAPLSHYPVELPFTVCNYSCQLLFSTSVALFRRLEVLFMPFFLIAHAQIVRGASVNSDFKVLPQILHWILVLVIQT